ncbi:unnamed protein product, partial [Owenia fusiformis]
LINPIEKSKPSVALIGSSILSLVKTSRMHDMDAYLEHAYTIPQARKSLESLNTPDVVVYQVISNDIKDSQKTDTDIIDEMHTLVNETKRKLGNTKIVLSLPPPRSDNELWNIRSASISAQLQAKYHDDRQVTCSLNSNLGRNGTPNTSLYRDGVHPNERGTSVLCKNILDCIRKLCNITPPQRFGPKRPFQGQRKWFDRW